MTTTATSTAPELSQAEKLRRIFEAHPNDWLTMPYLGNEMGGWAVHSRVAQLRASGMTIENKIVVSPETGKRHSLYRYILNYQPS